MFRYSLVLIVAALGVAGMMYFMKPAAPDPEAFAKKTLADREAKEKFMREDPNSPVRTDGFHGLSYFPPDVNYVVKAKLKPIEKKQVRLLPTSTGEETRYLDHAWAIFAIDGTIHELLILEIMDMGPNRGKLFLAFADETSASETYGGGRYLDLKKVPAVISIELDFNKAYNPYCAYNDSYSCPLPPRENILRIAIRAGEKAYK